jgi:hypothetical protein
MRITMLLAAAGLMATPVLAAAAEPTKDECIADSEEGQDLRRAGKISDAMKRFAACSKQSCPGPVRTDCETRTQEAERALPTIRFTVKDSAGSTVHDLVIRIDGSAAATRVDGSIPVDVGKHQFEFDGRGAGRARKFLDIAEGVKGREETITLEQSPQTAPAVPDESDRFLGLPRKPVLYISLVVAAVGVGAGSVLGLEAGSTYRDAKDTCSGVAGCKPGSSSDAATAGTLADISTGAFIVGGVALAVAAWNFLTTPKRPSTAACMMGGTW